MENITVCDLERLKESSSDGDIKKSVADTLCRLRQLCPTYDRLKCVWRKGHCSDPSQ